MSTSAVTADSITDELIEELRACALPGDHETIMTCNTALRAPMGSLRRISARARCAEIINERRAAGLEMSP